MSNTFPKEIKGKTILIPPETYKTYSKNIAMGLSVQWVDQILILIPEAHS